MEGDMGQGIPGPTDEQLAMGREEIDAERSKSRRRRRKKKVKPGSKNGNGYS